MPEVQEVFRMATQKVRPDPGFVDRQHDHRRRKERIRKIGAFAVAAAIGAVAVLVALLSVDRGTGTQPATQPSPPPANRVPETDYLLKLDTGEMTPLPESIVGARDRTEATVPVPASYAVSPDRSMLAYVAPGDREIFVANLDGTGVIQVTNALGAAWPAWSPDGSRIAYISQNNVFVLDLATGESTQLTSHAGSTTAWYSPPSFSPDGTSVVYSAFTSPGSCCPPRHEQVRIVPVAGGASERLVGGDDIAAWDGKLSPDGSLLSFICRGGGLLCLADADGTDARELVRADDYLVNHAWSPDGTRIAYWELHSHDVFVVDVASGEAEHVAEGAYPTWLDDHTLIVEIDRCYDHESGARAEGCPG